MTPTKKIAIFLTSIRAQAEALKFWKSFRLMRINASNRMLTHIYMFAFFILHITSERTPNKTQSHFWCFCIFALDSTYKSHQRQTKKNPARVQTKREIEILWHFSHDKLLHTHSSQTHPKSIIRERNPVYKIQSFVATSPHLPIGDAFPLICIDFLRFNATQKNVYRFFPSICAGARLYCVQFEFFFPFSSSSDACDC